MIIETIGVKTIPYVVAGILIMNVNATSIVNKIPSNHYVKHAIHYFSDPLSEHVKENDCLVYEIDDDIIAIDEIINDDIILHIYIGKYGGFNIWKESSVGWEIVTRIGKERLSDIENKKIIEWESFVTEEYDDDELIEVLEKQIKGRK